MRDNDGSLHDANGATDRLRTYVDDGVSYAEAATINAFEWDSIVYTRNIRDRH
jgi:hypothetical protein